MEGNMFRNYILVVLTLLFLMLGLLQAEQRESIGTVLQEDLIIGDSCTASPCLFDQPLQNMSYNQVQQIISSSDMRDNLILVDAPRNLIRWIWSSEFSLMLGVESYPEILSDDEYNYINEFNGFSSIGFRNGIADSVWLYFETQLSVLLETYGEPFIVTPLSYTRFGDMTFRIFFLETEGNFVAITRCDSPELVASTRIIGYSSTADEQFISDESIQWQGYTDNLPDCSSFQP